MKKKSEKKMYFRKMWNLIDKQKRYTMNEKPGSVKLVKINH